MTNAESPRKTASEKTVDHECGVVHYMCEMTTCSPLDQSRLRDLGRGYFLELRRAN